MTRTLIPATAASPTYSEAVRGDVATFVVHRSHTQAARIADLVTRTTAHVGTDVAVAVAARLPRQAPAGAVAFLDANRHAILRFADPEIFTLNGPAQAPHAVPSSKAAQHPWATSVPATPDPAWVREVLDAQINAGANVLLSASGWVGTAGVTQLDTALTFVAESRDQLGSDDPMFVNLTLHATWLQDRRFREYLLAEIVESQEKQWWVRVQWPRLNPLNYAQLRNAAVLKGYSELAQVARSEGKVLFLPNSGLTGWVATALGASGFSTGMSGTERAYEDKDPQGGGGGTARERYFEQSLLHTMLRADHIPLVGRGGHLPCGCPYCASVRRGAMDKATEQLHYLFATAGLTALLGRNPRRRKAQALDLVQQARAFLASLPATATPTGESAPLHLGAWEELLS